MPLWKRSIDVICCLLAFPFLALLTLVMLIGLRLVAPGPVFFRQQRIGYGGRPFLIFKFRTMHAGAETSGHQNYFKELIGSNAPMTKLDAGGDARLVAGGRLLRASGLDELPQVINVLRGEMSIVGPRPCLPSEYESFLPWQRQRCRSVPGLTGLWQVSGKNRTTFEEMIRLDIRYGQTLSWWLDTRIILLTVPALLDQIAESHCKNKPRLGPEIFSQPKVPARIADPVASQAVRATHHPDLLSRTAGSLFGAVQVTLISNWWDLA